ncbi:CAP domain-containing protein [Streptomyces erythrochromogenes]|uniref:CAP domain-containing protein n=1 Tax=Streptomyces erythrochromogenes TaxID=285574 RepID=UPI00341755A0
MTGGGVRRVCRFSSSKEGIPMAFGSGRILRGCTAVCASSLLMLGGAIGAGAAAAAEPVTAGARAVVPLQADPNKVLELVNQAREAAGCKPLTVDPEVQAAAQAYANDKTTDHKGSDGSTVPDRLKAAGETSYTASAENIAWGSGDEKVHVDGWLKSEGHKGNIENCSYTKTGVAVNGDRIVQVFTN